MTVRVGINGFGRIGRNFFRAAKARGADIDFVAVNDLGSLDQMALLLKRDSVAGTYPGTIKEVDGGIDVDGDVLKVVQHRNPAEIPWGDLGVDVVIESTGIFTETAGGVTVGVLKKLAERGELKDGEKVVVYITGEGLKTLDANRDSFALTEIDPNPDSFESHFGQEVVA